MRCGKPIHLTAQPGDASRLSLCGSRGGLWRIIGGGVTHILVLRYRASLRRYRGWTKAAQLGFLSQHSESLELERPRQQAEGAIRIFTF
jgi:hypothetical protein